MNFDNLLQDIGLIHDRARAVAGRSVDRLLTLRNWFIGASIVEYEQAGEDRAAYGEELLPRLARSLADAGHRGLGVSNLKNCRQVALCWPSLDAEAAATALGGLASLEEPNRQTASVELLGLPERWRGGFPVLRGRSRDMETLPWQDNAWTVRLFSQLSFSHLLQLSRIDVPLKRAFYELQSVKSGWTLRELKRQYKTMLYERVGLSKDQDAVVALAHEGKLLESPAMLLRDPYILEFLELEGRAPSDESALEQALVEHLQQFLLELGHDFCFMGRQYRVTVGGRHHFIDLLFYHRGLRCLVAFDLKTEPFRHEHAGQMRFYVNYLADQVAHPDESHPIGVILCTDKDAAEVHYATAGLDQSVFVSRYLAQLPSEDQLARWLREERALIETHREDDDG